MKRIVFLMLALFALSFCVFAEEPMTEENTGSRVEIEFCVGDATLIINGQEVVVEKPYVVGEGVTLVPVRVITEAFGAKVGWIKETKTITLEYPDVNIVLQIGNTTAEVNGRAETLLSAPELTQNGFTMVPLRFISESFGAEVGYDNETKRITVVKEAAEEGTTVEGAIENKYVGDSYYGWSMENPKDMYLEDRAFDGMNTAFLDENSNWIDIVISTKNEEYDFDDDFEEWKTTFKDYTLVKAEKDTSDKNKMTMHFQARNKILFLDAYIIVTPKYIYVVNGGFGTEYPDVKEEGMRILSTFDLSYKDEDIYDLSNVKDGMRRFEAESIKFEIDVPQELMLVSDEYAENEFRFASTLENDTESCVNILVFSKDGVESAGALAETDYEHNKKYINEEIVKFSEITEREYDVFKAVEYSYEVNATFKSAVNRDVFFEIGEYVYNVHVGFQLPVDNVEEKIDGIINSIVAEELDFEEVGTIMRNNDEREGTKTIESLRLCSFEVPKTFQEISASSEAVMFLGESGLFVAASISDHEYTRDEFRAVIDYQEKEYKKTEGTTILQTAEKRVIGGDAFTYTAIKAEEDDGAAYNEVFYILEDGAIYIFQMTYFEIGYSEHARQQTNEIIRSIEFE